MGPSGGLGVDSVCCLLHNMIPGGSGWQWVRLLGRHVESGGRAMIIAPPGLLSAAAQEAGIEVVPFAWGEDGAEEWENLRVTVSQHDVAIVHWDLDVMDAFQPALEACGRAALVLHQSPYAPARQLGAKIMPKVRAPIALALADERAAALVRGEWHRRKVATAFDVPVEALEILPASIPVTSIPFQAELGEPREILALVRLSPEKAAVAQLAIELTMRRLASGRPCRLTIAGDGPWREQAVELCERSLPRLAWQIEKAPANPIARLSECDLVVAQGVTTLEAAALGRRTVVARAIDADRAAGVVLTPDRYDVAARDPFGEPEVIPEIDRLWDEILMLDEGDLRQLRDLVERHNSLEIAAQALGKAIAATE